MGVAKWMSKLIFFLILPVFFIPRTTQFQSDDQGHISILVSEKGLDFAKDVLIDKAISSLIPLRLPDIEKHVEIPLVGKVRMVLSNITIYRVNIESSNVETGENGVVLGVSGATADLSMKWAYSYSTWIIKISDDGDASVQVERLDVRVVVTVNEQDGTLSLSVLECGCHVKHISIDVDGGASWLYQGLINAFQKNIISVVEKVATEKLGEKIEMLDSLLQSIPKQRQIDDVASLNLTFTNSPVLGDSLIKAEINGLFIPDDYVSFLQCYLKPSQNSFLFNGPTRMAKILLQEEVFNSATLVYFNANRMNLIINKAQNQSILNTAEWRLVIPELYRQYPDDKMKLNISVTSAPGVKITQKGIDATILLDVTIEVLDSGNVVPVLCISSVLNASCSAAISKNNLAGSLKLLDFSSSLKWNKFGDLQANSVRSVMSTILEAVFFPYVNSRLQRGFPLPIPCDFTIKETDIIYADSQVIVSSDVAYK